jgi:hypothetical protein
MKKLIKYIPILAILATALISCSSDSSQGMLRSIVDSQEEVSYTISKSSFNTTDGYFVSVESDGIWKAEYNSSDEDDASSNLQDHVQRNFYTNSGIDRLTSIQSIYTSGNDSYVFYIDITDPENPESKIAYFDNSDTSTSFGDIDLSGIAGDIKNLTENGYIISVVTNTTAKTSDIHLYQMDISTDAADPTFVIKTDVGSFFNSGYEGDGEDATVGDTRYNDYALVTDSSVTGQTPTIDGIIISLTDEDADTDSYAADDAYYYYSISDNTWNEIEFDDSDDDAESEPIVAATKVGSTYIVLTQDGDAYEGTISSTTTSTLTEIWDNQDNSDTFATHLPTLHYVDGSDGYLIGMDSYDYIYIYSSEDNTRTSTVSDEIVAYATDLNNASDVIFIQYVSTTSGIDTYWVATIDNGYYTIEVNNTDVANEDASGHTSTEGFTTDYI